MSVDLRGLLGGPRVPVFDGSGKEFRNWLTILEKSRTIYELSDQETLYLAYDATKGKASEFVRGLLENHPRLAWEEVKKLLTKEFADEGTAIEAMRALLKLTQLREETPGELGARAGRLSSLAFPEVVRDNAVMQAQLADLYVEALSDERVRHDVLKEGPLRLSAAIELARESQGVWDKVKRCGKKQIPSQEAGRRGVGGRAPVWKQRVKEEVDRAELWEEDPNRRAWSTRHGFYKPTPGRYGLVCWTCGYEDHRAAECPTKWGLPPDFNQDRCTRCGKKGHLAKWCGQKKGAPPILTKKAEPKRPAQGKASGPPQN